MTDASRPQEQDIDDTTNPRSPEDGADEGRARSVGAMLLPWPVNGLSERAYGATAPADLVGTRRGSAAHASIPVMTKRERAAFWSLTAVVALVIGAGGKYWLSLEDRASHPWLYLIAAGLIAFYLALWGGRWMALLKMRRPIPIAAPPKLRVGVATTFVPGFESLAMLEQTVKGLVAMRYPHETWVLDEGNDPQVRELCERLRAIHFARPDAPLTVDEPGQYLPRTKFGNYNAWLAEFGYERYDFVVSFDPDHVPEPHFLDRVLGYFGDPDVGYVQASQVYYNQDASFIARGAAEETYAYYSSHQEAVYAIGHPIVTGCHNAHRVTALRAVGGFAAHDADDLLITLLYRAKGWKGVYVPEILALGTTPVDWRGYLRQQMRWARSVIDIKLREVPARIAHLPFAERVTILFHGMYYLRPLAIPLSYMLLAYLLMTGVAPAFLSPASLLALVGVTGVITLVDRFRQRFYLDPQRERGIHWRALVLQYAKWPFFVVATWRALFAEPSEYVLTQKAGARPPSPHVVRAHLLVAAFIAAAWVVGTRTGGVPSVLSAIAGLLVAGSLALAWVATWRFPPAFDAALYERRRAQMADILTPP